MVLVFAVKTVPVPFQAVVVALLSFKVLEPPFKEPAVSVTSPEKVWVRPTPRLSVPPAPFMVKPAPLTDPVKVTDPAVLTQFTSPVVVKPLEVLAAALLFIKRTSELDKLKEPEFDKLPVKYNLPAPEKVKDPLFVKSLVPDCIILPVEAVIVPALLTDPEMVN